MISPGAVAALSTLPGNPPTELLTGSSGNSAYTQIGTDSIELLYDKTSSGNYSGANIAFASPEDISSLSELVFSASGPVGSQVTLRFKDNSGKVETRILTSLNLTTQYYHIPKADFHDVSWAQLTSIEVVLEDDRMPNFHDVVEVGIEGLKDPKTLTAEQEALRQTIISENIAFFEDGMGVESYTQFPYDQITYDSTFHNPFPIEHTQPTSIGFYAQVLGDAIRERTTIPNVTKAGALNKLETLMDRLIEVQADADLSWNGLMPFMDLSAVTNSVDQITAMTTTIGLGDNANMAQSIAVMIGALEGGTFDAAEQTQVDAIVADATTVLANMYVGFNAMFDGTTVYQGERGYFRHVVDSDTGVFSGFVDRMTNEFRATIAFLVSYYGDSAEFPGTSITRDAWDNLAVEANLNPTKRDYVDSDGDTIENTVPFNGGAFQMFWPLLRSNEQDYVEMTASLKNFLVSATDYSADKGIPGLPSAGLIPQPKVMDPSTWVWLYEGKEGIAELSESQTVGEELVSNVGNIYGIAGAFALDPATVMTWLDDIETNYPEIKSENYGYYDALISGSEVAESHYAIDQSTIVLALTDAGGDDFDVFMASRSLDDDFRGLYSDIDMQISLTDKAPKSLTNLPTDTLTVFDHIVGEGRVELDGNPFPHDFTTGSTGMRFNYSSQTTDGGHYWLMNDSYDVRESVLRFDYSVTTTPQDVKIVLRNAADEVLGEFLIEDLDTSAGIHTAEINITNLADLADQEVKTVHLIVEPTETGIQAADFYVHQIQFRHYPLDGELAPDPNLDAADVTTLPDTPEVDPLSGSGGTSNTVQTGTTQIDWTYDVSDNAGSFSGAMVHYDDYSTGGTVETADLSDLGTFVIGLQGPASTKVKVEVEDVHGNKDTIVLNSIGTTENFYEIRLDYFSNLIDWTQIKQFNYVIDQSLVVSQSGTVVIRTAGLEPAV